MSYLQFDKTLMTNLEEALPREVLRTNRSGGYHCTTVVDCNTRKYHGLLVVPVPEMDDENHVLLSSLDETVIQHGAEFNLGLHQYNQAHFSPLGHKYIREFNCVRVPTTWYRVGGVILKKEKIFVRHEDRILIRYTLVDAHSPTTLRLRPFLAFRSVRVFTQENNVARQDYESIERGIAMCMYEGYPTLSMQLSKDNEFVYQPTWYKGIEYRKELERGYDFHEDLFVPGYFEVSIKKGESIVFSAGTESIDTQTLIKVFADEANDRTPRSDFKHCLINAAHQFLNKQGDEYYILAGYPWFKCRGRDLFVSLPGLTLSIDEESRFQDVMHTAVRAVQAFMRGEPAELKIYELHHPDVLLWAVWCIQQYAKHTSQSVARETYGEWLREIVTYYLENRHPVARLHENGLLHAEGYHEPVTWMNAQVNGQPVTPRSGYIVEVNALWYNALNFIADLWSEEAEEWTAMLRATADRAGEAFVATFLNEHGYLLDYVDGYMQDWSVRPNMVIAIALDYSPLNSKQKKGILDIATKELLTPKGLRTLSPKSMGYNPICVGTPTERDYAYHQGTAWPWLEGFYFEAYLKLHRMSGTSFVERQLIGFEDEMSEHCIATLSELYDGNPPFRGRGAVSFAMNIAALLRTLQLVEQYANY